MDSVFAVLHALSAPIWENPTTSFFADALFSPVVVGSAVLGSPDPHPAAKTVHAKQESRKVFRFFFFIDVTTEQL